MDTPQQYAHIKGWGADLDHANRPAYPRERKPNRLEGVHWHEPENQALTVEILRSNERPAMTPLFGTTVPPTGVSGNMRRFAFRYSENDLRHWLILLAADRVQMVEGLVDDLSKGHVPNAFAEMGGPAEIRHNPVGAAKKALVMTAVVGIGYLWLTRDQRRRPAARLGDAAARLKRLSR
jgi:hypothetical protein